MPIARYYLYSITLCITPLDAKLLVATGIVVCCYLVSVKRFRQY